MHLTFRDHYTYGTVLADRSQAALPSICVVRIERPGKQLVTPGGGKARGREGIQLILHMVVTSAQEKYRQDGLAAWRL
jgi:hypothetical protein